MIWFIEIIAQFPFISFDLLFTFRKLFIFVPYGNGWFLAISMHWPHVLLSSKFNFNQIYFRCCWWTEWKIHIFPRLNSLKIKIQLKIFAQGYLLDIDLITHIWIGCSTFRIFFLTKIAMKMHLIPNVIFRVWSVYLSGRMPTNFWAKSKLLRSVNLIASVRPFGFYFYLFISEIIDQKDDHVRDKA